MINFPGLGISLNIEPVAFRVCGIGIYWYAICIVSAMIIAIFLCSKDKSNYNIDFEFVFESFIISIFWGIIGARIYYAVFRLNYYLENPLKIFNIRDGGLAIYGGLIAGLIVMIKRCKKYQKNIFDLLDYIIPFVCLAQSIGRWGNFFNKEAYGTRASNIFRMGITTSEGYMEVHPTFLYESISTLLIFGGLIIMQKNRKFKGQIVYLYLFMYSGIRMVIEGLRADSLMLGNLRISQILSVAIFVISGIMLLKNKLKYIYNKTKC